MNKSFATILIAGLLAPRAFGDGPETEMKRKGEWLAEHFGTNIAALPFSFVFGGRISSQLLSTFRMERAESKRSGSRSQYILRLTDPATGLVVDCEVTEFANHPALEWVIHFENTGANDTPVLENILALDELMESPAGKAALHYSKGATCSMDDYQPLTEPMIPGARLHLQAGGGRSSSDFLPFFNWETPPNGGVILGLGWSGEWAADFTQPDPRHTSLQAGQALTRMKLHPRERIRTPRLAMLFYTGDWIHGQNLWRRFLLEHHRPMVNGKPLEPPILNGNWGGTHASNHIANIRAIADHDLPVDYYWIDAEWFGTGAWWQNAGNWQVKKDLYPDGFKPISDQLHQAGRKLLLWFEPERVCERVPWATEISRWLLSVPVPNRVYRWDKQTFPDWVKSESLRNQIMENDSLFNLAIPEARQFLTDFISERVRDWGLDCYRHDANIAPLEFWRAADAPDRQGITEIRWVEGLYAFWDGLFERYPGLIIDNCASGGRRIDLETLGRSTPFWRSDFPGNVTAKQCHTYGLSFWVPLNATGAVTPGRDSNYAWRSTISSSVVINLFGNGDTGQTKPPANDFPFAKVRGILQQYRQLQPYFLGDYYPLTAYSKATDAWLAWQFHRSDLGEGMVQAFRRELSVYEAGRFPLRGLEPDAKYAVTDLDAPTPTEMTGRELMDEGLLVHLRDRPSAALITYKRL